MNKCRLQIYTLGSFKILREGKEIKSARKSPKKPLSMLKALIAFGGKDVRISRISNELWPDANGIAAHNAFTTTLSRLRQLIGVDINVIILREGCLSIDRRYGWIDVWEFEALLNQADETAAAAATGRHNDEYVRIMEKAIGIYRGDFLVNDIHEPWTFSIRENLRNRFVRGIVELGHHWEAGKQFEKAMGFYHKGLEVCDLAEELYQRLMICYDKIGCNADVVGVYKRLEKVLSAVSGIAPSLKTEQIFKSLIEK